jgi:ABC-2 type transport system permease protein
MARYWLEFRLLFAIQMLEERVMWVLTLFFTTFFPLFMVFGLGSIGSGQTRDGLLYVITGSTVVSLVTVGITMVSQQVSFMKEQGVFLYYASLPISKGSLLLAVMASRLILQLPGIVVALVGGSMLYHFRVAPNPLLLLILPLTALALSGVGAALGLLLPSPQLVSLVSQVAIILVLFGAPVLIPIAHLPLPLQAFGLLLPPTYAADALRRAIGGLADARLLLDLIVLSLFAALSLAAVTRGLRWRLR